MEAVDASKAPVGATHRYDHACTTAWYREVDGKLFVWRDGSWHAGVSKSTVELAASCMLGKLTSLVDEKVEPVDDDLTWLVRESRGEWFGNSTHIARDGDLLTWATFPRLPEGYHWFTKEQYLARRAELQNKPSWEDAPEWAEWLAQHESGFWCWGSGAASISKQEDGLGTWWSAKIDTPQWTGTSGEVLGDWSDTLELRPADLSEPAVTERLTEATQNVLAAVPALKDEQFKFEQNSPVDMAMSIVGAGGFNIEQKAAEAEDLAGKITALLRENPGLFSANELSDLHQLCDDELTKRDDAVCGGQKYLEAHWFERGELPPVGAKCEFCNSDDEWTDWHHCIFVGKDAHGAGVISIIGDDAGMLYRSGNPKDFRPIRTEHEIERDELIKLLKVTSAASLPDLDILASAIVAAGFKRGGGAA